MADDAPATGASLAGHPLLADPAVGAALALAGDPGDARLVGGAVRDMLLGRPVGDVDIATRLTPEAVIARAKAARVKVIPTGIEHGTVTVLIGRRPFEVTTLRRDVETDGRRAVVAFSTDFRDDALRRDFTINALSATPAGAIHDYWDGLTDLAARRVRFIGAAEERIREDYLRILRFFRFHAAVGQGEPDAAGLAACAALKDGLATLSRERIRQELLKLLAAPGAVGAAGSMQAIALWPFILPGGADSARLAALARAEAAAGLAPDPLRSLAAIARAPAAALQEALRLSKAETARLAAADQARAAAAVLSPGGAGLKALLYRHGTIPFRDGLLLAALNGNDPAPLAAALTLPERWSPPACPIDGARLAAHGVRPGPAMGRLLKAAEAAWIAADFPLEPAAIDRLVSVALASAGDRNRTDVVKPDVRG
jgi:tRNA nucleotidyltransferase/poly(A) polymerase